MISTRLGLQALGRYGFQRTAANTAARSATATTAHVHAHAHAPALRLHAPLQLQSQFRSLGTSIQRYQDADHRNLSQIVIHNGIIYISAQMDATAGPTIEGQTRDVLTKVDELLEEAGTSKAKLLTAAVWLKHIERDFGAMNALWNEWQDPENKPVRVTVETNMVNPEVLVEIQVTAALM